LSVYRLRYSKANRRMQEEHHAIYDKLEGSNHQRLAILDHNQKLARQLLASGDSRYDLRFV